ncbi:DNA mismatch repair endonuclease MutL [Enterococcus sp. LJL98]
MGKIQELSESLSNQIAAGEVVERPASVVKELVENAIDAGSTQIDILLEEAGLKKIQIIDNGEGMSREDARNAFKRHATSKIHTQHDLDRIRTLGFRGEALPSIASVSEITLETSLADAQEGTYLFFRGGVLMEEKAGSPRPGTKLTVENLFFNTPARLKYVKTLQTELANVGDIVNRLALSHPGIAFRLVHDGNRMLHTTGNGDLRQCIAGIYGVAIAKKMQAVSAQDLDFKLSGYISLPELTRASRNYMSLIVNGRYVKNIALNRIISSSYGSKLMVGRFPLVVLTLEMDPSIVDVNVHPTKQEVKFSKEAELFTFVTTAIQESLKEENLIPKVNYDEHFQKKKTRTIESEQLQIPLTETKKSTSDLRFDQATGHFYVAESTEVKHVDKNVENTGDEGGKRTLHGEERASELDRIDSFEDSPKVEETESVVDNSKTESEKQSLSRKSNTHVFPHLEYFGQMHGTYLFAQSEEGLYIVDQHAAQERIKYEYYRKKIGEVGKDLQSLLVPIVLEYPQDEWLKIVEKKPALEQVGIYLEDFGQRSFIVREHPTWYEKGKEEVVIQEIIQIVLETGQFSFAKFREATAIMMSCKKSIKANHYLNAEQGRVLLADLAQCENPFNCPHGRPVLIHFSNREMERMFKRIQDTH